MAPVELVTAAPPTEDAATIAHAHGPVRGVPDAVCRELCELGGFARVSIAVGPSHGRGCRIVGSAGLGDAVVEHVLAPGAERGTAAARTCDATAPDVRMLLGAEGRAALAAGTLTAVPLRAAGRHLGFLVAQSPPDQRPGDRLSHAALTAFALGAAIALRQDATAGDVAPAPPVVAMAKHLHDTVAQRLTALSLLLAVDEPPDSRRRERCREEVTAAMAELRAGVGDALAGATAPARTADEEAVELCRRHPHVRIEWLGDEALTEVAGTRRLVDAVVAEALRNARKHARPRRVEIELRRTVDVVTVTVRNDGVAEPRSGCGMGLRLLETEAAHAGGLVESCAEEGGWWRLRLILAAG